MAATLIQDQINLVIRKQGRCRVMLTGGRSSERLYRVWSEFPQFQHLTGVLFYIGDERCVPADHLESNYGMIMRSLFPRGVPPKCSLFPIDGADPDYTAAARRYDEALPEKIDVLLLSIGEDGHIASLFPGSDALYEKSRRVVPIVGPKLPRERLTITPPVINQAGAIFVLAAGAAKAAVLSDVLEAPNNDVRVLPACLVLHATWLLDTVLPESTITRSKETPCPRS